MANKFDVQGVIFFSVIRYFFMKRTQTLTVLITVCIIVFISCDRIFKGAISGTWVSEDKMDTIIFKSDMKFTKGINSHHEWNYLPYRNQIEIQYHGPDNILVVSTTHELSKFAGKMKIDFSNERCHGFPLQEITYFKE